MVAKQYDIECAVTGVCMFCVFHCGSNFTVRFVYKKIAIAKKLAIIKVNQFHVCFTW